MTSGRESSEYRSECGAVTSAADSGESTTSEDNRSGDRGVVNHSEFITDVNGNQGSMNQDERLFGVAKQRAEIQFDSNYDSKWNSTPAAL